MFVHQQARFCLNICSWKQCQILPFNSEC